MRRRRGQVTKYTVTINYRLASDCPAYLSKSSAIYSDGANKNSKDATFERLRPTSSRSFKNTIRYIRYIFWIMRENTVPYPLTFLYDSVWLFNLFKDNLLIFINFSETRLTISKNSRISLVQWQYQRSCQVFIDNCFF